MLATYAIARIDGDGTTTRLTPWQTYDQCDDLIDELQDRFPNAIVDIFPCTECSDL